MRPAAKWIWVSRLLPAVALIPGLRNSCVWRKRPPVFPEWSWMRTVILTCLAETQCSVASVFWELRRLSVQLRAILIIFRKTLIRTGGYDKLVLAYDSQIVSVLASFLCSFVNFCTCRPQAWCGSGGYVGPKDYSNRLRRVSTYHLPC